MARCAQPFFSVSSHSPSLLLSLHPLFLRRMFIRQHTRRHVKKTREKDRIQLYDLPLYRYLSSISPLFSRTVHGALPITTYIVFSNNGKILRPHRHFHPLCHLIGAFFKGKTKLPARLLMVANDRRVSIRDQAFYFHQWIQLSIILYSLFFSSPLPSIHNSQTLFIIRQSTRTDSF